MNKNDIINAMNNEKAETGKITKRFIFAALIMVFVGITGMVILVNIGGISQDVKKMMILPLTLISCIPFSFVVFRTLNKNSSNKLICVKCKNGLFGADLKLVLVSDKCPHCGEKIIDA